MNFSEQKILNNLKLYFRSSGVYLISLLNLVTYCICWREDVGYCQKIRKILMQISCKTICEKTFPCAWGGLS